MDYKDLCMGCMKEKDGHKECPYCSFDESSYNQNKNHLKIGTVLQNRYIIGKTLGAGGFGITYIAFDKKLGIVMAIKEFLPSSLATRDTGNKTVSALTKEVEKDYKKHMDKFLEEARRLAQLNNENGIVSIQDFFKENNTVYIVMFYVCGITLEEFLRKNNNKLSYEETMNILEGVMKSLINVHEKGLIHRDISPDNIYITDKDEVKLLDFGAARYFIGDDDKSLSIILKRKYAPTEQYLTKGKQGPWTDVYAICATIYRCITGGAPPESIERMIEDEIVVPSKGGINIPVKAERALMKGLSIDYSKRYQDVGELLRAMGMAGDKKLGIQREPETVILKHTKEKNQREKKGVKIEHKVISVLLSMLIITVGIFYVYEDEIFGDRKNVTRNAEKEVSQNEVPEEAEQSAEVTEKNDKTNKEKKTDIETNEDEKEEVAAKENTEEKKESEQETKKENEKPNKADEKPKEEKKPVKKTVIMPDLRDLNYKEAAARLDELNLDYEIFTTPSHEKEEGVVLSHLPAAQTEIDREGNYEIVIAVCNGEHFSMAPIGSEDIHLEPFKMKNFLNKLEDRSDEEYSRYYTYFSSSPEDEGRVLAQNPPPNQWYTKKEVFLVKGKGYKDILMPDFEKLKIHECIDKVIALKHPIILNYINSYEINKGWIIKQIPQEKAILKKNEIIEIFISMGESHIIIDDEIPVMKNYIGKTYKDVLNLDSDYYQPLCIEIDKDGIVEEQYPPEGVNLRTFENEDKENVIYNKIKSEEVFKYTIPDLIAMNEKNAEFKVQSMGMRVMSSYRYSQEFPYGFVIEQSLLPGSKSNDEVIYIIVSLGPPAH